MSTVLDTRLDYSTSRSHPRPTIVGTFTDPRRTALVVVQILSDLGLPFATFNYRGDCVAVSKGAESLLGEATRPAVRFGELLVTRMLRDAVDTGEIPARTRRTPDGNFGCSIQRLPGGDRERVAVMLIQPLRYQPRRTAAAEWGLSPREDDVAKLIAAGAASSTIAASLGISVHTVRRHTERVYAKLGVSSRAQLIALLMGTSAPVAPVSCTEE